MSYALMYNVKVLNSRGKDFETWGEAVSGNRKNFNINKKI